MWLVQSTHIVHQDKDSSSEYQKPIRITLYSLTPLLVTIRNLVFEPPVPQLKPTTTPSVAPPDFYSAPNEIIDLLNHPTTTKGDIIDMDYTPTTVATFRVRSTECQHNLTGASATASAWFTSVGTHLQEITNPIGQVQAQITTADQDVAKNTALIEANVEAISQLTQSMAQESQLLAQAQKNFNDARNALVWIPWVAIILTIVDLTKEQGDVDSAQVVVSAEEVQLKKDQDLVANHGEELEKLQKDGIALHAKLTGLQAKVAELQAQKSRLTVDSDHLGPLKVNIDHCINVGSAALGSASNIANMMSMTNVGVAIKGLVAALKDEGDFTGALVTLNEKGFVELDKQTQAMQKVSQQPKLNV
ncbi:hypothetical protein FRB95_007932 [Tulasnella sp. JGI-2019a]|nr:hypothetical protein FRB95_007932 [Tulasnella sp. JGI-2019a]